MTGKLRRGTVFASAGLLLALLCLLSAGTAGADSTATAEPNVLAPVTPSTFDGDLSEAPRGPASTSAPPEGRVPGASQQAGSGAVRGSGSARTPGDGGDASVSAPLGSFPGMQMTGGAPPDPTGEIGPNHYVEATNVRFQIFNRSGASLAGPSNVNTIWAGAGGLCEANNDGDPIVMYDQLADRWIIAQFAVPNPYAMCVAISATADPVAGGWFRYEFATVAFPDYEKFGIWRDGLYMTTFEGANLGAYVFDLDAMRAGLAAGGLFVTVPSSDQTRGSRLLPADTDGTRLAPAGAPNVMVETIDAQLTSAPADVDRIQVYEFQRDIAVPPNSTFTKVAELPTAPFDNSMCYDTSVFPHRDCIPQPGTGTGLDPLSHRPMWRASYRNFGDHESIVFNQTVDTGGNHAGIRWYELRKAAGGGGWSIFQQGTFSPDGTHRWMGSAAINRLGEVGLGYSASSSSLFPGLRYTGRVASDPPGQLGGERTLVNGAQAQTSSSRWGDYSHMSIDPLDDCTMWYVGEFGDRRTQIGSFQVSDCVPDTTIDGPSGPTADSTPQFTLGGDEPDVTFECSLDGAAFTGCPASYTTPALGDGPHTLAARAKGIKGALDPTPAERAFAVDTKLKGSASAKKKQKQQGKNIVVKAKAKAKEDLDAKATGKVKVGKKSYKLKPNSKSVRSGKSKNLKLKLKKTKNAKKIAKALKKGEGATAKLTVELTDALENTKKKKLSVRLKR